MELSNLRPAEGSKHSDNFRRGRGHGSGNGKTAGKGHKGQLARSGHKKPGFEGGQMPLYRRLPKRGFKNRNTKEIIAINVDVLNHCLKKSLSTPGTGIWQPIRMIKIIHIRYNSLRLISFTLKTFLRVSNIRSPLLYHQQLQFLILQSR